MALAIIAKMPVSLPQILFILKLHQKQNNNKKLSGLSPLANYIDRMIGACWRS
jgi:hypothetical protein